MQKKRRYSRSRRRMTAAAALRSASTSPGEEMNTRTSRPSPILDHPGSPVLRDPNIARGGGSKPQLRLIRKVAALRQREHTDTDTVLSVYYARVIRVIGGAP